MEKAPANDDESEDERDASSWNERGSERGKQQESARDERKEETGPTSVTVFEVEPV